MADTEQTDMSDTVPAPATSAARSDGTSGGTARSGAIAGGSIPNRVVIDFLEGTRKRKDAIAFAKGFIEHHFDSLDSSGWFCTEYEDGYAFEVQEGGSGAAFLPAALEALNRDRDAIVCIRMSRRILQVKRSHTGGYTSILLPEGMDPAEDNLVYVEPRQKLTPYRASGIGIFATGIGIFAIGLVVFALTLLVYLSGVLTSGMGNQAVITDPGTLPIEQWERLSLEISPETYVTALKYEDGEWRVDTAPRPPILAAEALPRLQPLDADIPTATAAGTAASVVRTTTDIPAIDVILEIPRGYGGDN